VKKIICIPDGQNAPGRPYRHWRWINKYVLEIEPDAVVQLGDWNDMSALSSYDKGKKRAEGKRVQADHNHSARCVDMLQEDWDGLRLIALEGNHDGDESSHGTRMNRYVEERPELAGSLPQPMDVFRERDWEVVPFLEQVKLYGVRFSHFFPYTASGKVSMSTQKNGSASAAAQLNAIGGSCVAGHKQGLDYSNRNINGQLCHSLIVGSCYLHDEHYLTKAGNNYWRGVVCLSIIGGDIVNVDLVSLRQLQEWYA
jgi:hypothetical protein